MYIHSMAFSESLRKSFRAAGHFQQELAEKIGLRPKVLSRKLNGTSNSHLTDKEVRRIIIALIGWKAITTRGELCHLLALAHLKPDIFSEEEWQRPPLSQLEEDEPLHNLTAPLTRFVGREEQVEQLRRLLVQDDTRLVTLFGPGGSGKTRLAQQVANELKLTDNFPQGVWFVALAAVRDSDLVLQSIMQTLYIQSLSDPPPLQSLIAYFRHMKLLLIIDNFEQVAGGAKLGG